MKLSKLLLAGVVFFVPACAEAQPGPQDYALVQQPVTKNHCAVWAESNQRTLIDATCGTGGGTPGGANNTVQTNNGGSFGGVGPGTATQVLHGNAAGQPSYSPVALGADVTGNLPPANLDSGTNADGTHFWAGDGHWKVPPSSSGTVTNVATGACLTGGPITGTGTISGTYVNRTVSGTTDTILSGDACAIVKYTSSSAVAVTVPQATTTFGNGFSFDVRNAGTNTVTLTPTTSTINGAASLALPAGTSCTIWSDGTNWQIFACTALSARLANSQTFNGEQRNCITTLTASSNTYTPDNTCNNYKFTLAATNTLANFVTTTPGASGIIEIDQDGTGSRTLTWGSQYMTNGSVSTLTLSTGASSKDFFSYFVPDSTHILVAPGPLNAVH
jgi:hypothetical protein